MTSLTESLRSSINRLNVVKDWVSPESLGDLHLDAAIEDITYIITALEQPTNDVERRELISKRLRKIWPHGDRITASREMIVDVISEIAALTQKHEVANDVD